MGSGVSEGLPRKRTGCRLHHRRYAERSGVHTKAIYQRTTQEKPAPCEIPTGLEGRGA